MLFVLVVLVRGDMMAVLLGVHVHLAMLLWEASVKSVKISTI
jgi:hypothetical protein